MIKALEFPNRTFETKKELFSALKENATLIIASKKANKQFSENITHKVLKKGVHEVKGIEGLEEGYIYPVINTTNLMDSHKDVHFPSIWKKSLKEKNNSIHYLSNHKLEIGNIIAFPKDVEPFTQTVKWSDLGESYDGETQALIYKVKPHTSAPKQALAIIEEKMPIQNSVRMEYVKISLAVNSNDKDFKEEKKTFDKYIETIANKDEVLTNEYFWAVTEAKVIAEGSMVVKGSNHATPIAYPNNEPSKQEPSNDTQKELDTRKREMLMKNL